jgi:carboxymethylenebutenolidase
MFRNLSLFLLMAFLVIAKGHAGDAITNADETSSAATLVGEAITLKTDSGIFFKAYRAGPRGAKRGILLLHEWWGLNDSVRRWADFLGESGYRVLAIDLYNGKVADSTGQAKEYMAAVNQEAANAKHRAALNALKAPGRKLITMGWGFGGSQSLQAGFAEPNVVSAVVIYDGVLLNDVKAIRALKAAVLGIFAKDTLPDGIKAFETTVKQANKIIKIQFYNGSSDFSNPSVDRYRGDTMSALWKETQAFLNKYVK